jgi:hypothetical protein
VRFPALMFLTLGVSVAACVYEERPGVSEAGPAGLAPILAGRAARPPVSCVSLRDLGGNRSVGEEAVVFGGNARRIWVNRPPAGCPSLEAGRTLVVRTSSGRLCRGDIVTVFDPVSHAEYGGCGLGDFTPYDRVR